MFHASGQRNQCKYSNHHHRRQRDCDRRHELCPLSSSTCEPTLPSYYLVCSSPHKSPATNPRRTSAVTSSATKEVRPQFLCCRLTSQISKSFITHIAPNGKRAARQQGDPFSMGGSSNGGKAIGTLWCKSMFGSGWCQDTIPVNRNTLKTICLRSKKRLSSVFLPDSPRTSCNQVFCARSGRSGQRTSSVAPGSDSPGAGSKTPVLPPPTCPAALE